MSPSDFIRCEILAPKRATAKDLASIIQVCALDMGLNLHTQPKVARNAELKTPVLTLHLNVEASDQPSPVWCLACRLACFCPEARVSVLVHSERAFGKAPASLTESATG